MNNQRARLTGIDRQLTEIINESTESTEEIMHSVCAVCAAVLLKVMGREAAAVLLRCLANDIEHGPALNETTH